MFRTIAQYFINNSNDTNAPNPTIQLQTYVNSIEQYKLKIAYISSKSHQFDQIYQKITTLLVEPNRSSSYYTNSSLCVLTTTTTITTTRAQAQHVCVDATQMVWIARDAPPSFASARLVVCFHGHLTGSGQVLVSIFLRVGINQGGSSQGSPDQNNHTIGSIDLEQKSSRAGTREKLE